MGLQLMNTRGGHGHPSVREWAADEAAFSPSWNAGPRNGPGPWSGICTAGTQLWHLLPSYPAASTQRCSQLHTEFQQQEHDLNLIHGLGQALLRLGKQLLALRLHSGWASCPVLSDGAKALGDHDAGEELVAVQGSGSHKWVGPMDQGLCAWGSSFLMVFIGCWSPGPSSLRDQKRSQKRRKWLEVVMVAGRPKGPLTISMSTTEPHIALFLRKIPESPMVPSLPPQPAQLWPMPTACLFTGHPSDWSLKLMT